MKRLSGPEPLSLLCSSPARHLPSYLLPRPIESEILIILWDGRKRTKSCINNFLRRMLPKKHTNIQKRSEKNLHPAINLVMAVRRHRAEKIYASDAK
jgi:hypothetical protein